MKKILTFIPLGVGISAAIIYIFNVIQFRVINNSVALLQILSNLKIYLYVSIISFIFYILIKILISLSEKKEIKIEEEQEIITDNTYEPFEEIMNINNDYNTVKEETNNSYVPNYDYVPVYKKEEKILEDNNVTTICEDRMINETITNGNCYCFRCGEKIYSTDNFCFNCGTKQVQNKKRVNSLLRKIINILEIVILLLIIYFSLNMLFDYKEKVDPNFKSPFNISMTK